MKGLLTSLIFLLSIQSAASEDIYSTDTFQFDDYSQSAPSETNSFSSLPVTAPVKEEPKLAQEEIETEPVLAPGASGLSDEELADLALNSQEIAARSTASREDVVTQIDPEADKAFRIKLKRAKK